MSGPTGCSNTLASGSPSLTVEANVLYYNKWAAENLDRNSNHIGEDVRNRHRRAIANLHFNVTLKLFEDDRTEPVRYVARSYGKTTILVTVSPIFVLDELV